MLQGTGSNTGKSLITAGLCRAFTRRGLKVRPFKPQNMSNNAAVTEDGGEIGRAQALQALACGVAPVTDMNPVLLKPETETGAQVILRGKRLRSVRAREYQGLKARLLPEVLESFARLRDGTDLVLVEGAGSPAETNLRRGDIANMGFAEAADLPVILIGDIDRGGVIAQVVGTRAVLEAGDANRIKGFLINKFRGDPTLFSDGLRAIARQSGWPSLGLVPWFDAAARLPAEDALDIRSDGEGGLKVAVPVLSRIANFDDLDPLKSHPGMRVEMVPSGRPLPGDAHLVILPGTKATIGDLAFFRAQGWDIDLHAHIRRGGHVLGICGGYQMLGRSVADPEGIEGSAAAVEGLGWLDVATEMLPEKRLGRIRARDVISGHETEGYEIHIGRTAGPDTARAWLEGTGSAASPDGRILGCYLHGLFADDGFRTAYLARLGAGAGYGYRASVEAALDGLAAHLERHVDLDELLKISR